MRILQLTSHLHLGGVPSYVASLSETLRARGHEVIVASERGVLVERLQRAGVAHWRVPLALSAEVSWPVYQSGRQLDARLRAHPVDMIHAHTRVAQVVADGLSRRRRIPYVTTWHGFFTPKFARRWWPCTGALTIAVSAPVAQSLGDDFQVPGQRIRVIPNGVNVAYFSTPPDPALLQRMRQQWRLPADALVIGAVGRLASGNVKGFDCLLEAASIARRTVPALQVLIVGDGPGRAALEAHVRRLGLEGAVHFLGAMEDIRPALALMDVFVFPSREQEGFGLSLIEAMAAGRAVVSSRAGARAEIVEDGRSGWLANAEDPADLARCVCALAQDSALRERLGADARARVRVRFSLERMTEQVEQVYKEAKQLYEVKRG